MYSFDRAQINEAVRISLEYCGLASNCDPVLRDLIESVCIIQEDGLHYTFVHRSFQEYFSALFLVTYRGPKLEEFVRWLMDRPRQEDAGAMLLEMARDTVERHWALPLVTELFGPLDRYDPSSDCAQFMMDFYESIDMDDSGDIHGFAFTPLGKKLMTVDTVFRRGEATFLIDLDLRPREEMNLAELLKRHGFESDRRFGHLFARRSDDDDFEWIDLHIVPADGAWIQETDALTMLTDLQRWFRPLAENIQYRVEQREKADASMF